MTHWPVQSALLTDLYELTMAQGYWATGRADREAVFHLFFRRAPFGGGFALTCGLEDALNRIESFAFTADDLAYLRSIPGNDGKPLFRPEFLDYLANVHLDLDVDAMPEGTVAFPHEPLLRVRGGLLSAQLVETALLNAVNFPTLVATKAARIVVAAAGSPVIEFGLRRAQGPDGGLTASRSAYVGGCEGTSNVLAGQRFGIPVRGTHAHSWVLSFDSEAEAFRAYVEAMPNNAVLLVDTYDTLEGVDDAIEAGRFLRSTGHDLAGVRLDSGDLAYLSRRARQKLDDAGFPNTKILASNDLDEETIESLRLQHAQIDSWGVGTRLVTADAEPALGGVYKLAELRRPDGSWRHVVKVSEQAAKTTVPGILGVRRYYDGSGVAAGDAIYDTLTEPVEPPTVVHPTDPHRRKQLASGWEHEELLIPVVRHGRLLAPSPTLDEIRAHATASLARFDPAILRRVNPHAYPAGLESALHARREALIEEELADERGPGRSLATIDAAR
ncbi:MAG TPA: nicotinate phosphoribosyltransferase [Candidatus Saccharimonadales bacterium]|nr:nicotinate phosphoribosyltransferase [Candidatus Saccharimonadales bacterium]